MSKVYRLHPIVPRGFLHRSEAAETMASTVSRKLRAFRIRDEGSTMTEYAILAALIGVALIAVVVLLAGGVTGLFTATVEGFDQ